MSNGISSRTAKGACAAVVAIVALAPLALAQPAPGLLDWGVLLQADRAFYAVGDEARVLLGLFNFTEQTLHGWSGGAGGNGCEYTITVEDERGAVVWRPRALCLEVIVFHDLPSGTVVPVRESIPLVYQNDDGIGVPGEPLPAGLYRACAVFDFNGPQRESGTTAAGLDPSACVPLRIE